MRECYSRDGAAWDYFPHAHARSRAYRWGEDGLGGFCDIEQRLCLSVALWNERDPFLKERLFGLTAQQGNHGEDVKEIYHYLDATPTHSYLRMSYLYPHAPFPYEQLVEESARRTKRDPEFELIDTGVFDEDRYFDVVIEYAKAAAEDIAWRITVTNRGPEEATVHVLPTMLFRNTWSWMLDSPKPHLDLVEPGCVRADHRDLGAWELFFEDAPVVHFCANETNRRRVFGERPSDPTHPMPWKDAIHHQVVGGHAECRQTYGTKASAHRRLVLAPGATEVVRARLRRSGDSEGEWPPRSIGADFDALFATRRQEADAFYAPLQQHLHDEDTRSVDRQALAGMIWTQQLYRFEVRDWLTGDPGQPPPPATRLTARNARWGHLSAADVFSMPDTWEYPWFAAWDLAIQAIPLAQIDPQLAMEQLLLLTGRRYIHASGALPAYEWNFSDANPPVHAWATWQVYEKTRDLAFLQQMFEGLLPNFAFWMTRRHATGLFGGGFLGLDNVAAFDRSGVIPGGGELDQADGSAWMANYALTMMRMAIELSLHGDDQQAQAIEFWDVFVSIDDAMRAPDTGLWHEQDRFFYDRLQLPSGPQWLRSRSVVGVVPLFAVETVRGGTMERLKEFGEHLRATLSERPELALRYPKVGDAQLFSLVDGERLGDAMRRVLDEEELLSPFGVRSLSKAHALGREPFRLRVGGHVHEVHYAPGGSDTDMFGGNSNWRGPVWFPFNYLLLVSLARHHEFYGDRLQVEHRSRGASPVPLSLSDAAALIAKRLRGLFTLRPDGTRASIDPRLTRDANSRERVLFHEFFHGDTGQGLGASHQTGWTSLIATLAGR